MDLQVVGGGVGDVMDPQYCIMSDTTGYASTNLAVDPGLATEYNNDLLTAAVIDEGGNAITVRYRELSVSYGDYHIGGSSSVIDNGGPFPAFPELTTDFDGEPRPSNESDIGADENTGAGEKTGAAGRLGRAKRTS